MGGRPGYIFEIFQNGHIFLKFYFFFKYKKEKTARLRARRTGPACVKIFGHRRVVIRHMESWNAQRYVRFVHERSARYADVMGGRLRGHGSR